MNRILWLVSALILISVFVCLIAFAPPWTGFEKKTLWDWMGLIMVPAVIAVGGALYKSREEKFARALEDRCREEERALQLDRFQEEALQDYFGRITELMLREGLSKADTEPSKTDPQPSERTSHAVVRSIARARTLTVLQGLDGPRKGALLKFLYESGLITKDPKDPKGEAVIDLMGADLAGADLSGASLSRARLINTNLTGAKLTRAVLTKTDLRGAILVEAVLVGTWLAEADLYGADLSGADLGAKLDAECIKAELIRRYYGIRRGFQPSGTVGLTQDQLNSAKGDENTKVPDGLVRPSSWSGAAAR
jgi:hypothetical protein